MMIKKSFGQSEGLQVESKGAVAELADALDLGSSSERSAGSIPVSPTSIPEIRDETRVSCWEKALGFGL